MVVVMFQLHVIFLASLLFFHRFQKLWIVLHCQGGLSKEHDSNAVSVEVSRRRRKAAQKPPAYGNRVPPAIPAPEDLCGHPDIPTLKTQEKP